MYVRLTGVPTSSLSEMVYMPAFLSRGAGRWNADARKCIKPGKFCQRLNCLGARLRQGVANWPVYFLNPFLRAPGLVRGSNHFCYGAEIPTAHGISPFEPPSYAPAFTLIWPYPSQWLSWTTLAPIYRPDKPLQPTSAL